jgi:endonuclease G
MKGNFIMIIKYLLMSVFIISVIFAVSGFPKEVLYEEKWKIHVELGIPQDDYSSDDYLIKREQYVLSYDQTKNAANWGSWNVNASWYGSFDRVSDFKTDTELPEGWYRAKKSDYTNTKYDRGHIIASNDRSNSEINNTATFLMTNILPQRPDLNQGPWKQLETRCSTLCVTDNKELYIIAGGVFNSSKKIKNKIAVPDSCYKIVIILNRHGRLEDVNSATEVIAVMMPNVQGIKKKKWETYKTTIDQIEQSSGYDFLSAVPNDIEDIIESRKP